MAQTTEEGHILQALNAYWHGSAARDANHHVIISQSASSTSKASARG